MTEFQPSQHPCLVHNELLQGICKPLSSLYINFFGYTAVDNNGDAYCLGSKPSYALEYLRNKKVTQDIQHRPFKPSKQLKYDFWDFKNIIGDAQKIYEMAAKHNQSHTLTITRHDSQLTHCYHFSGSVNDHGINQRYLDKMDLLHAFIERFDDSLKNIPEISSIYDYPTQAGFKSDSQEVMKVFGNPRDISLQQYAQYTLEFKHFNQYYLTKKERHATGVIVMQTNSNTNKR